MFLAKYDSNGTLLWVRQAGSAETSGFVEQGSSVAVDGTGNAVVTGVFKGNATFAGGATSVTLTSAGFSDIFVAKYAANGDLLWAQQVGSASDDRFGSKVAVDGLGHVLLQASLGGTPTFGTGASKLTIPSTSGIDVFLAKYAADGMLQWVEQDGSPSTDIAGGVEVDATGNIYLTGSVSTGAATFGKGAGEVTFNVEGSTAMFLAKYSPSGALVWVREADGAARDFVEGREIAVDAQGNAFVTGCYRDRATFGSGNNAVTLTPEAGVRSDLFLARYDSAGELLWVEDAGSDETDQGNGVAVDSGGNAWITGTLEGVVTFGEGASALTILSGGARSGFVAQYDPVGTLLKAFRLAGGVIPRGIAPGSAYVVGGFSSTATFDGAAGLSVTTEGLGDIFLVKYGDAFSPADLRVAISVDKLNPQEGESVTFTVTVTNAGPSEATGVRVVSPVPVGLVDHSVTPSQGSFTATNGTWDVGAIANGTNATLTLSGTAGQASPITVGSLLDRSDQADPDLGNNFATSLTNPELPPGSSLTVTNTQNNGLGSLRNAIEFANANPNAGGPDRIVFAIPPGDPGRDANGVCTLALQYPLALSTEPVFIDGLSQEGASDASWPPSLKIVLDGSGLTRGGNGIILAGGGSTVQGLVISGFSAAFDPFNLLQTGGAGIRIEGAGGNTVWTNFFGLDVTGAFAAVENDAGIQIIESAGNVIGGNTPARRNLISYGSHAGVIIEGVGASNNTVLGNFIGTNAAGDEAIENCGPGILIVDAPHNMIGGADHDAGVCNKSSNLISGNDEGGILIEGHLAVGQTIQGNFIGTTLAGDDFLLNEGAAILSEDDSGGHLIGGLTHPGVCSKASNLVTGNVEGIIIDGDGGAPSTIQGNFIGTDATGLNAIGNGSSGIEVSGDGNLIGGATVGLRNVIAANKTGIDISGADNVVQGNYIGVGADGTTPMSNEDHGVAVTGSGNLIGGTEPGQGNVIANNGRNGIGHGRSFSPGNSGNRYLGNAIFGNAQLGIDLDLDGVTANDSGDGDGGVPSGNELQNYPVIASASSSGGATRITGTLDSTPNTAFRLEFFANDACNSSGFGEGEIFLGAADLVSAGGPVAFDVTLPAIVGGKFIAATATDENGNTSEFSACVSATGPTTLSYADWTLLHALVGAAAAVSANPDFDSEVNGIEFALGGDPNDGLSTPSVPVPIMDAEGGATYFIEKPPGLTGITYQLERSTDLEIWTSDGLTVVENSATFLIVYGDPAPTAFALRFRAPKSL